MEEQDPIYWHEAFFEALQLEFHQYASILEFVGDFPLSKEALIIDALVIKKLADTPIHKNIGRIFKKHNIFEYKSETISATEHDYTKLIAYGLLYSSFHRVAVADITVSLVVTKHPRNLLAYLKTVRGFAVENKGNGLYYVTGDTFCVQILESKLLSKEENLFLRNLRSTLNAEDATATTEAYRLLKPFSEKNAYLDRLIKANTKIFEEAKDLSEDTRNWFIGMCDKHGWLQDTYKQQAMEIARAFKASNVSLDIIAQNTKLTLQEVEAL